MNGIDRNTAASLSYLLGPITGVVFYIMRRQDPFVRFNAVQSILLSLAFLILIFLVNIFSLAIVLASIVGLIDGILVVGGFLLWLMLIYKTWLGQEIVLPVIGPWAKKLAS